MKILKNGILVDITQEELASTTAPVNNDYQVSRQLAYEAAGITLDRITELTSEIQMYELEQDTINAQAKQSELNALLLLKSDIRQLYPKPS